MTAREAPHREPKADAHTVHMQRLLRVTRAARVETTATADEITERVAIEHDEPDQQQSTAARQRAYVLADTPAEREATIAAAFAYSSPSSSRSRANVALEALGKAMTT